MPTCLKNSRDSIQWHRRDSIAPVANTDHDILSFEEPLMKLDTSSIIALILLATMVALVAVNPFGRNIVAPRDVEPVSLAH